VNTLTLNCRFCNSVLTKIFADLGRSPLSNAFLRKEMLDETEKRFPLCVYVCENCFLVQLPEFEKPENIFEDYAYLSSYSKTWLNHAKNYVEKMITRFNLKKTDLVMEIASNDGYLLQYFYNLNIPCIGIEPAKNVAQISKQKGIETLIEFFGTNTAKNLVSQGKMPDLLIGNNVLAHVPNINDFVEGMKTVLKPNGIITLEFPHLMQLIAGNQFDTIYHEHFSYISFYTANKIFEHHKLKIFDVDELPTHGGSLRVYVTHTENYNHAISARVKKLLNKEIDFGITEISTYTNFQQRITKAKNDLCEFFSSLIINEKKLVILIA